MLHSLRPILVLLFGLLALPARGYPPAPGVVVEGLVRDQFGFVLGRVEAEVVFKSGGNVIARAPIAHEAGFGWNYRVLLPADADLTGTPYRTGALLQASVYTAEIHVGGTIYLPIETLLGGVPAPEPATTLTLNLTLGNDSDGDGLPDDWELWQLQMIGIFPGNLSYNLMQLGVPGDYDGDGITDIDEFLIGTIATLRVGGVKLTILEASPLGGVEMEHFAILDKAYELESSTDGVNWAPVPVRFDPLLPGQLAWTSTGTEYVRLYVDYVDPVRLYRLRVR